MKKKRSFPFEDIFNFCSEFFGHVGKRLDKKVQVNFKIYDVTNWEKIITIQILPNISRSKRNQTNKCVPLIEYNMRNIAVTKPYIQFGGKTSTQPFSKK